MILALAALIGVAVADTPVQEAVQAIRTAEWKRLSPAEVVAASDLDDPAVVRVRAQALGRLRDARALPFLKALQSHEDEGVRREVAFALGLTPGSAATLRAWLYREKLPAEPLLAEHGVRWQLVEALGRAGGKAEVPLLVGLLDEPWPFDDAAARSLVRLQRSKVDLQAALAPLIRAGASGRDPRTERTIAGVVARIGLGGVKDAALLDAVEQRAMLAGTSAIRALWTRAAMTIDDRARVDRVFALAMSDDPLVVGTAIQHHPDPSEDAFLAALVRHYDDAWVWSPAIARKPEIASRPEIAALRDGAAPTAESAFRQAWILEHGGTLQYGGKEPWPVQAALLGQSDEVDTLVDVAIGEGHPAPLRTAAAGRLHDLGVDRAVIVKLLQSPDVGVREAAMTWLEGPPDAAIVEEVELTLRVEKDGEVLRAGLNLLTSFRKQKASSVRASRFLTTVLKRSATHRSPGLQKAARELGSALGVELPGPPPDALVRELILPDGTVTTTTGDLPKLLEVEQIVGARIQTEKGTLFLALHPEVAPLAVYNFASLAGSGFYRGVLWHRVVPGFVVQAGCPRGDGWGGPGWTIVDEVSDHAFVAGGLGMARGDRDTGGSQFFVMSGPGRFLDGDYTWFGELVDGTDVVRRLEQGDRIQDVQILRQGATGGE
ncbi:MAG: peptidylprolyl isomerase [Myxococcota bacterium]